MDNFNKMLDVIRGPKPIYVEGAEPLPATCDECGQEIPGEYAEPPHVVDCPCGACRLMRRLLARPSPFSEFGKKGQAITFRKLDSIYPAGRDYRPEY